MTHSTNSTLPVQKRFEAMEAAVKGGALSMITYFELRNFKCFIQLRLSLKNLTLLTGFNAGGKSSAVQPLLLLAQGLRSSVSPNTFALNGSLARLGTVGDVLPSDSGIVYNRIQGIEADRGAFVGLHNASRRSISSSDGPSGAGGGGC